MRGQLFNSGRIAIAGLALAMLLLGGCAGSTAKKPGAYPGIALKTLEYDVLETVEGSGEVTTILCFIRLGDKKFGYSFFGGGVLGLSSSFLSSRDAAAAATYDAISKVPEADMMLPLTTTAEYSGLGCLFREETATVRGRAIRIRD